MLLGMTGEDQQSGAIQIEFGDKPDEILRKRRGVCTGFSWDPEQEHYRTMGVIETFEYAPARLLPGPWNGGSRARADGTAHGYLVAFVRSREDPGESHRWELERDPDPTGAGGIPEEDRIHRAALGSRFLGLMVDNTNEAGVVSDQSLKILPPPRGLTIKDGNRYTDREDLVFLLESNVI